jgi:iron complex outermembrane receptor protein
MEATMNGFKKLPLCAAIGMLTLAMTSAARSDEQKDKDAKKAVPGIEEIVVTGSLIQRPSITDIVPVSVIDTEDMAARGLVSLGDVMESMTENSGYTEGKASNLLGRFTTGAEEVNLRGMGVGRTLLLVNGRRIADYPLPFGGEQNGADIGTLPFAAVARVDYLSGGASATYGSDAVGGVVNIITKRDMEQTIGSITTGMYEDGYGGMADMSLVTGNSYERGSFTVGVEAVTARDVLASEVDYFEDNAPFDAFMVDIQENSIDGLERVAPSAQDCAALGFRLDTEVCASEVSDTITVSPEQEMYSGFFDGRFDLNDQVELFGTALITGNTIQTRSNVLFFDATVVNEDGSAATFVTRGFSDAELGIANIDDDQLMWTATVGAKGGFEVGAETWYWDASYSHSIYESESTRGVLKEEGIRNWLLAGADSAVESPDQQYTWVVDSDFYNDQLNQNVLRPVAAQDMDGLVGEQRTKADTSGDSLTLVLNGVLGDFSVFHGPVKFALLGEIANQSTHIDPDERSLDDTGNGWYNIGAFGSDGERDRQAVAIEFQIPALADLDLQLSARYDHYDDASDVAGRFTGQARFMYRLTDWLKMRGNYSQIFRAPDMYNLYGTTDAFEPVPDFMRPDCYDGVTYNPRCGFPTVATTREADTGLTEEHGDDISIGLIWNPVMNFVVTADYYELTLKDLVVTEFPQDLLLKEWQCANGELDGSSQLCADVNQSIVRNNFGEIERIVINPINQDERERKGIDIRAQVSFEFEKLGAISASLSHSKVLDDVLTRFSGDESINLRYGEPGASTAENTTSIGLSWFNPLTTGRAVQLGLFGMRYGNVYDYSHTQFMDPMWDVNFVAGYQMNARTQLRFSINNLLDSQPDVNESGIWPYFWAHMQMGNALGRSGYLTVNYSFN